MNLPIADITAETLVEQASRSRALRGMSELWLVVLALIVVAALVFLGVYFFRKPPPQHSGSLVTGSARKRVRRRRRHRPRNPTLAETGGLPPRREDGTTSVN